VDDDDNVRFLLDGLEVESIKRLRQIVEWHDKTLPIIAALAIYGENVNLSSIVEKARALNEREHNGLA
jgi:hypothetical protein